jgi:hypothetical protein
MEKDETRLRRETRENLYLQIERKDRPKAGMKERMRNREEVEEHITNPRHMDFQ